MDAQDFRMMAQRCRDLLRIAVRSEVKEQLRQWVDDFEAEAAAIEGRHERADAARPRQRGSTV